MFGILIIILSLWLFAYLTCSLFKSIEMGRNLTRNVILISFILALALTESIFILMVFECKEKQIGNKVKYEKSIVTSKSDTTVVWKKIKVK